MVGDLGIQFGGINLVSIHPLLAKYSMTLWRKFELLEIGLK